MPSSSQRTPDAGRYRSNRAHLPWSRLQHAERDGDRRRHRRRDTPTAARSSSSGRFATTTRCRRYGTHHGVLRSRRSAHRACAAAHVVRGARSHDGRPGARDRRRLAPAARHLRFRAAARQRLRERARRAAASALSTPSQPLAGQLGDVFSRADLADLDGFEHDAPVRARSRRPSAARARSPASPARAPSSASPDRKSGSLPRTSPTATRRPIASTWSARGWRRSSPARTRRSTPATARA